MAALEGVPPGVAKRSLHDIAQVVEYAVDQRHPQGLGIAGGQFERQHGTGRVADVDCRFTAQHVRAECDIRRIAERHTAELRLAIAKTERFHDNIRPVALPELPRHWRKDGSFGSQAGHEHNERPGPLVTFHYVGHVRVRPRSGSFQICLSRFGRLRRDGQVMLNIA